MLPKVLIYFLCWVLEAGVIVLKGRVLSAAYWKEFWFSVQLMDEYKSQPEIKKEAVTDKLLL